MTRYFYYGTVILALLGIGLSWLIFPGDDELAFLQYKDKWYSKALVLYEVQVDKGNYSPQVVSTLTDLYLKYGYIDKAVLLMERFVQDNPRHIDALKRLGLYYQYAQRHADYRRSLEMIHSISPDPEILRKLSAIYSFMGNQDRQMAVLKELVDLYPGRKQDHLDLAYLYAARKSYDAAIVTLESYIQENRRSDPAVIELMLNLLLDADKPEQAFKLASSQVRRGDEKDAIRYANRLHARNQHQFAYQLLIPYQEQSLQDPQILLTLVSLEIAQGNKQAAFDRLAALFDQNRLPVNNLGLFVSLLIERDDQKRIQELVREAPLEWITRDQLFVLVNYFDKKGDAQSLKVMHRRLNPEMRAEYPVLNVKLTMSVDPSKAAAAASRARGNIWITDEQRLQLALLYHDLKMRGAAREILADVRSIGKVKGVEPYDIAALHIALEMAEKGLLLFDRQLQPGTEKSENRREQIESNALMLALAAGRENRVMQYLKQPRKLDIQQLVDLYYLAESEKRVRIMLETSRQLLEREGSDDPDRFIGFRVEALLAAKRRREALPHLRLLVARNYPNWIYVYADTLEQLGLMDEWSALWTVQSRRADLARSEKRGIAFTLLDKGYRSEAKGIFKELAAQQPPEDPDVNQLVFIWQADADPSGLQWLEERIDHSSGPEGEKWLAMFYGLAINTDRPRQVESVVTRHPHLLKKLTTLEIAAGRQQPAYERLALRNTRRQLQPEVFALLINLAVELGKKKQVRALLQNMDMAQIGSAGPVKLFNLVLRDLSQVELRTLEAELGNPFFSRYPEVAVMFQAAKDRTVDKDMISDLAGRNDIEPNERLTLAEFFLHFGLKETSEMMMAGLIRLEGLSENEQSALANLYLKMGRPEAGLQLFDRQRGMIREQGNLSEDQLNGVHLLLAAAAGRTAEVTRFLNNNTASSQLLTDLYFVSVDFDRRKLALLAAEKNHRLNPSRQTQTMKTRALLLNKKYRDALPNLVELVQQEPAEWEYAYIETLEILKEKQKIRAYWRQKSEQPDLAPDQKRELAFVLIEKGDRERAESLFLELADRKPADSREVDQLMFLWGIRPKPKALSWMKQQLQAAPPREKAGWLKRLVEVGQEESALGYIERHRAVATPEMIDVKLEILVRRKDREQFTQVASQELEKENRVPRLKKIARLSTQVGATGITVAAWDKAYRLAPEDRESTNEYGKTMYYQANYEKAETLLRKFVDSGGMDHVSAYFIAEILWQKKYTREAKPYYRKSLEQISLRITKDRSTQTLEARIRLRLGQKEEALDIFRELRRAYPQDESLKADYIDLLLELGYTEEADKLLADI